MARRYVHVTYPWAAAYQAGARAPLRYYSSMIKQTLGFGMPARRYGRVGAWFVRHALPEAVVATGLRPWPRRERSDIDELLARVTDSWADFAGVSARLPHAVPSDLSALVLKRRTADTVFVFGEGDDPLVVCKIPREEPETVELEDRALREAEPSGVAPLALGRLGDAYVQEALPGAPLEVEAVTPGNAASLPWRPEHEELARGLRRLAETTVRPGPPQELRPELKDALERAELAGSTRERALKALDDLEAFDIAVLRHGDTSAQNCLFFDGKLTGLVDWAIARPQGAPAFDILNAAVALVDHGVGSVRWSEERAVAAFEAAWSHSAFFEAARTAARRSALTAGASDADYERLEIAFFARRLASRVASPKSYATGPASAARMLEIACGR